MREYCEAQEAVEIEKHNLKKENYMQCGDCEHWSPEDDDDDHGMCLCEKVGVENVDVDECECRFESATTICCKCRNLTLCTGNHVSWLETGRNFGCVHFSRTPQGSV